MFGVGTTDGRMIEMLHDDARGQGQLRGAQALFDVREVREAEERTGHTTGRIGGLPSFAREDRERLISLDGCELPSPSRLGTKTAAVLSIEPRTGNVVVHSKPRERPRVRNKAGQ